MKSSSVSKKQPKYSAANPRGFRYYQIPSSSVSECKHRLTYLGSGEGNVDGAEYCVKCDSLIKLPPQSGKSSQGNDYPEPKYATKGDKLNSESGKEWESIAKLSIIDENEGTITFSYNELVNLLEGK